VSFRPTVTVCLCALALLSLQKGPAQTDDEDRRRKFLKTREESVQPSRSKPSSKPKPKPKPKPHPGLQKTPARKTPSPTLQESPTEPSKPVPAAPARKELPPEPRAKSAPPKEEAPLLIEKSGFDSKAGMQPPAFFGWFSRWKYLPKSLREQIDRAPVQKSRWRYLVVHNSGTRQGNAKAFDFYHTNVRKMPNGLAYQFVIGNGTSSGDGEIEVGSRWRKQINGGHVHSDYLNNIALGICLVGDFNQGKPTQKQLESLDELLRYLRQRVGKVDNKWAVVKAHREINPPRWPTDCPGNDFPYTWLHNRFD
jgi:N-acetylmuramoyl-L-alanine amidase